MKILINTIGRTGSTNLLNSLSKELDLYKYDEPFNPRISNSKQSRFLKEIKEKKNIIVKNIFNHRSIHFNKSFLKHFDIVLTLVRTNTKLHLESLLHLRFLKHKHNISDGNVYHNKYVFEDIPTDFVEYYKKNILTEEELIKRNNILVDFSKNNKIKVISYEELYSENQNPFKVLQSLIPTLTDSINQHFNIKDKYRKKYTKKLV